MWPNVLNSANTLNLFWSICQKIYPKNSIADRIQSCWYPLSNSSLWDTHKVPPGCAITFSECIEQRVPMVFQPFGPSFFFLPSHLLLLMWSDSLLCISCKTQFNFAFMKKARLDHTLSRGGVYRVLHPKVPVLRCFFRLKID